MTLRAKAVCFSMLLVTVAAAQMPDKATVRQTNAAFNCRLDSLLLAAADSCLKEQLYDCALEKMTLELDYSRMIYGETHPKYATSLNTLAEIYKSMGSYERALPLFQQALKIRKNALGEKHPDFAASLNNLAGLYKSMGSYMKALPLYQQALRIRKEVLGEKHPDYARSLNNLAALYQSMGSYEKALPLFQQALQIRRKLLGEKHPDYATSLNNLAGLYRAMGSYEKALPLYLEALQIRKETLGERHPDYAISLNNLADFYKSVGNYEKALPLYHQALQIRKEVLGEKHPDYATSLNNLADLYESTGSYEKALPLYLQASQIWKEGLGERHPNYATSLNNLAGLYRAMGSYEKALPLYLQALEIRKEELGEKHPKYATSLNNLAGLYRSMGDYEKALPLYIQALHVKKVALGEKHPDYAKSLNNLALLYVSMGSYEKALPLHLQALQIYKEVYGKKHPDYATSLNNLALLYVSMGSYEKALPLFRQALQIWKEAFGEKHRNYAECLNNLAIAYYNTNQYQLAIQLFRKGNKIVQNYVMKGAMYLGQSDMMRFVNMNGTNFEIANSIALRHHDQELITQGVEASLLLKNIALQNNKDLYSILNRQSKTVPPELMEAFANTRNNLALAYEKNTPSKQTDSLASLLDKYEQQLILLIPKYRQLVTSRQVDWKQVQQILKTGEAVIEFVHFDYWNAKWTDTTLYAAFLLLPREQPRMISLCTGKILEQRINDTIEKNEQYVKRLYKIKDRGVQLANSPIDTIPSLYELLWQPLDSLLSGVKTIYYAPEGLLNRINLAAINYSGKKVLGDKYSFHLMGSTRDLVSYRAESINLPADTMLLYGNIDFDMDSSFLADQRKQYFKTLSQASLTDIRGGAAAHWESLAGSLDEVNELMELTAAQKAPVRVFTQKAASEESFKYYTQQTQSPAIIHIATHGFFFSNEKLTKPVFGSPAPYFISSPNAMLRSGIVFAGANRVSSGQEPVAGIEDGIITAYDISNINLSNTKLMVLSACETGLGKIENTEGVFGLQRAIRIAGCKNLIMSLWKVPDVQTARFMKYFYTQVLQEHKNLYESFQYAQQQMRELFSGEPYFWAGFVLME